VVADGGEILKTMNGGQTWTNDSSGTWNGLNSIFFTDSTTGYVVGDGGTILKTGNGGEDFVPVYKSIETRFTICPNPAKSMITITSKAITKESISANFLNAEGNEVLKKVTQTSTPIDISDLPPGIYLIRIVSKKGTEVKKLVVE
jgi:hypothetical protein